MAGTVPEPSNLRGSYFGIVDGAATEQEWRLLDGSISMEIGKHEVITIMDRGRVKNYLPSNDRESKITFQFKWEHIYGDAGETYISPFECMTQTGGASAFVSTLLGTSLEYAFDIKLKLAEQASAIVPGNQQQLVFENCVLDGNPTVEMPTTNEPATISFSVKCQGSSSTQDPKVTRSYV